MQQHTANVLAIENLLRATAGRQNGTRRRPASTSLAFAGRRDLEHSRRFGVSRLSRAGRRCARSCVVRATATAFPCRHGNPDADPAARSQLGQTCSTRSLPHPPPRRSGGSQPARVPVRSDLYPINATTDRCQGKSTGGTEGENAISLGRTVRFADALSRQTGATRRSSASAAHI